MPSDNAPAQQRQQQSQQRPGLGGHRSSSSMHSQNGSPSTTPPPHHRPKGHKHVVSAGRVHTRAASSKGAPKLTKHAHDSSFTDMRKLTSKNSSSATNLKKNVSHANLRRNRSSADVTKRAREEQLKRPVSVHFEIGDQDRDDGWEEASSTASPTLSRSVSRSAASSIPSSAKRSATNSQTQSPAQSHAPPVAAAAEGSGRYPSARTSTEGRIITERLLQRTPSYHTTKMSLTTATPTSAGYLPDDMSKSQDSTATSTAKVGSKEEVVSRFVGGSGTPSDGSPFLRTRKIMAQEPSDDVKRVQSMGNLAHAPSSSRDSEDESALTRRSRHPSQAHAYIPPQQSRTQQKLWLQRASSNIEPQQMGPNGINGIAGLHGHSGLGVPSLVDADDDGRDPRTRIQLERTGLEYLVVRRHQDPVGAALKRLERVPGMERVRTIPAQQRKSGDEGAGRFGLSQSLRDARVRTKDNKSGAAAGSATPNSEGGGKSSFDAKKQRVGVGEGGEEGVTALLRSMWEKSFDMSASAE